MNTIHERVTIDEARAAQKRIARDALRTPLVRLNVDADDKEIYLKLENLQPIGSFKIRGAANAIALANGKDLERGVWTASAGNMAQGVAWVASRLGIPCTVVVPDTAPQAKREAIQRLGAKTVAVPFDDWLEVFRTRRYEGLDGLFVHAFSDRGVMAGNATIGLEIIEDLGDLDTVVVPYGGGGLISGIASVMRDVSPDVRIFASEVETAAPLGASLNAGKPVEVEYIPSFIDGIGAPFVFDEMFELVRPLINGSLVSTVQEVAEALRLLIERNHVVAEGAGAAPLAAALSGGAGSGKIVCIVSGGNIDISKVAQILNGEQP